MMSACVIYCMYMYICMYTMERPVLLVQVARQRVSVPLRRLKHTFLFGGGELLAVLPEVAAFASLPTGDSCCQAFYIIHQLHVAAWWKREKTRQENREIIRETEKEMETGLNR